MAEYKDVTAIKAKMQSICDGCWHPHRLGGCPEHCGINDAIKIIDSVPLADAVPVVHGRWVHHWDDHDDWLECSECGYGDEGEVMLNQRTKFCPNCGARMDGGYETD